MSIAGRMAAGVMTEGGEIAGGGQSTSGGEVAGHSMAGDLAGTPIGGQAAGAVAGQPVAGHSAADMAGGPVGGRPAINAMCETAFDGQFGLCEAVLGWGMNPDGVCRIVSGCGCGELCESRVFPTKADCEIGCFGRVEGAPFCDTVNANEFGLCNQFLGFGVDESGSCVGVSGCGCGERCAGRVFDSIEDCQQVCLYNRALQETGGMDGSAGEANAGDAAGLAIVGGAASADNGGSSAPIGGLQVSIDPQVVATMCEDGQGCYLSRDATKCLSAGTLVKGEACEAPNDCAPGLHCLVECREVCSVQADHPQSCAQVCPEPPAEVIMAIGRPDVVKFTTVSEENELGVCLGTEIPGCDIFGDDCLANEGCYPVRGGNACIPAGTKTPGTPCDASNECQPGICVSSMYACPIAATALIRRKISDVLIGVRVRQHHFCRSSGRAGCAQMSWLPIHVISGQKAPIAWRLEMCVYRHPSAKFVRPRAEWAGWVINATVQRTAERASCVRVRSINASKHAASSHSWMADLCRRSAWIIALVDRVCPSRRIVESDIARKTGR